MPNLYIVYKRGAVEVCSEMKGIGLYLARRVGDGITYCLVAMRKNLLPSYSQTQAEGRMESIGSDPVSLTACPKPLVLYREKGKEGHPEITQQWLTLLPPHLSFACHPLSAIVSMQWLANARNKKFFTLSIQCSS